MKRKCGLRRVVFFLAICAGVFSACLCVLLMAGEYQLAQYNFDIHNRELQGWEACRQTKPAYFKANEEAVRSCLKSFDEARDNFWVRLPKAQMAGLFILAGLGGATGGYLLTWSVVWFGCLGIYRFFRWLVLCFRGKPVIRNGLDSHKWATKMEMQRHLSGKSDLKIKSISEPPA